MANVGLRVAFATATVSLNLAHAAAPFDPPEPGWYELERPQTPDTDRDFYPAALSGDGHIVVGREWFTEKDAPPISRAAIWYDGQLSWLAEPPRGGSVPPHALAYAINRTGSVIAGLASLSQPQNSLNGACIWYQGVSSVPNANPYSASIQPVFIGGCDSSGTVLVGRALTADSQAVAVALRPGGTEILETLSGAAGQATAVAVSHDGKVVVGYSSKDQGVNEAVFWKDGNVESLGILPEWATASFATDVNQDGTVIVGRIMAGPEALHFRWENGTYIVLDGVSAVGSPDIRFARAIATSADGSVIVGGFNDQAFYWTAETGTRTLRSVAADRGVDLPCCVRLLNALDVSDDGRTILVQGRGADVVVTLPGSSVPGDVNGDGLVNLTDLTIVLNYFGTASTQGDLNGDGFVDLSDLIILLQNFGD
jgi:probable HAF family extracellular repeat protein